MDKPHDIDVRAGPSLAPNAAIRNINPKNDRFDAWQELQRALSIVHVAGLELVAEIETAGEQSDSTARQTFEEALKEFHDVLAVLEILPSSLRLTLPSEG